MKDEELKWKLLATYVDYKSRFGPQTGVPRIPKKEEHYPVNPDGLAAWNRIEQLKAENARYSALLDDIASAVSNALLHLRGTGDE